MIWESFQTMIREIDFKYWVFGFVALVSLGNWYFDGLHRKGGDKNGTSSEDPSNSMD